MNQTGFAVSQFENRNGITSWRVAGWLHGVRIRKNFKTKEEAAAEKAALELNALQAASGLRATATSLSNEQIREAEAVFRRLEGRTQSLGFYVDFALTNYRDPVRDISVADATKDYVALRETDFNQGNLSKRQFTSYRCELRALEIWFRGKTVAELTAQALTDFFKRGNASKKSYNNRRGLISAFLKHGLLKDWVGENVITKVPYFRGVGHRRGSAVTLNEKQCADIMTWAEENHGGALVPFIALCLFAGIRPDLYEGEISKLEAKDVRLDTGVILIEPHVSKVRMKRSVRTLDPGDSLLLLAEGMAVFTCISRQVPEALAGEREKLLTEFARLCAKHETATTNATADVRTLFTAHQKLLEQNIAAWHNKEQQTTLALDGTAKRFEDSVSRNLSRMQAACSDLQATTKEHHAVALKAQQWVSGVALETRLWPYFACTTGGSLVTLAVVHLLRL